MAFEPMLFVRDVEATSRWFQALLGLTSGHGGPHYEMLMDAQPNLVLQLHPAAAREHGDTRLPVGAAPGAGVLFYFQVDDVRALHAHATNLGAHVEGPPAFARQAGHTEFVVRDPDGYALAIYQRGEV